MCLVSKNPFAFKRAELYRAQLQVMQLLAVIRLLAVNQRTALDGDFNA